jgi:16S rRNA processing protein RimM
VRLEVGRIGRAHGLKGEVAVTPTTNRAERFAPGSVLWAGGTQLTIASARRHQERWLVRFDGVEDRTAAEQLKGTVLSGDALNDPGGAGRWVHELIGSQVMNRAGELLGRVVAVEANPAHDLLVLEDGALVPVVFIVDEPQGGTRGTLTVDVPAGLLEVNRAVETPRRAPLRAESPGHTPRAERRDGTPE